MDDKIMFFMFLLLSGSFLVFWVAGFIYNLIDKVWARVVMAVLFFAIAFFPLRPHAQDFEPDRRPEESLYISTPISDGSFLNAGFSGTSAVASGSPVFGPRFCYYPTLSDFHRFNYTSRLYARPFTVALWYKGHRVDDSPLCGVGYYVSGAANGMFYLTKNNATYGSYPYGSVVTSPTTVRATPFYSNPSNPLLLGQWIHVALTADASFARLYINGSLLSSVSLSGGGAGVGSTGYTSLPMGIGAFLNSSNVSVYSGGPLTISDFRFYESRALSAAEVYSLYTSTIGNLP